MLKQLTSRKLLIVILRLIALFYPTWYKHIYIQILIQENYK